MRPLRALVPAAALAGLILAPTAASAQDATGTVTVVHGIPDTTVDVFVNGDLTLDDFEFGTVTDPLELPAGDYTFDITAPDAADNSDPILTADATLEAGANVSAVAHLTEGGDPTATLFVNDIDTIAAGEARVTVRHTAAAPAVDILAGGDVLVPDLSNPNEAVADVPAGDYDLAINAAGTDTEVLALPGTTLAEGTNTIAYAVGSLDGGSFEILVQAISGLHDAPEGVPAGDAGLADSAPFGAIVLGLMGLGALALAARRPATERN
ncbi:MAG TPA: DUF4397 domain-containing protein [Nitriliruptoraceae bacterium]|nr:DUF4397 domain-containing protein [Nitriliruptoraceae bacterium]